jgi:DNA-binding transcriptional LysR family regulator
MNLRDLRYFVALAEDLQFSRTARKLSIAQPSLSQKISGLESELGVRLFARDTRQVNLTSAGKTFLLRVRNILAEIEQATDAVRRIERGESGHIKIGFVGLAGLDVLPLLLRRLRGRYPSISVSLFERSSEEQARNVLDGSLDVGIVREPNSIVPLMSHHLVNDPQILAIPADHRLARRPTIKLRELRNEAFIMFPRTEGTGMYDRIIGACARTGFSPRIVQEAMMMTTTIGLVAAKVGVAIVPSVTRQIREKGVVYRPFLPRLTVDTGLIWNAKTAPLNPALVAFLNMQTGKRSRRSGMGDATRTEPRIATMSK